MGVTSSGMCTERWAALQVLPRLTAGVVAARASVLLSTVVVCLYWALQKKTSDI
jgi:hypothetical protein